MSKQISAVDIKRLWYADPVVDDASKFDAAALYAIVKADGTGKEIKNVHGDTWQVEEAESSQDSYKNQLTNSTYRMGAKTMGDVTFNFTIGRYDYELKQELMGGTLIKDKQQKTIGWARQRGIVEVHKMLVALTEDDVYIVLPYANVNTREGNTDGAIGLAVVGTMLEPNSETVMPEYWYHAEDIKEGQTESTEE